MLICSKNVISRKSIAIEVLRAYTGFNLIRYRHKEGNTGIFIHWSSIPFIDIENKEYRIKYMGVERQSDRVSYRGARP